MCQFILRILTGNKDPQIKLNPFRKVWIWTFGWLIHQINSLYEILKLRFFFRNTKVVTGKTPFFTIGPFCNPILFVLTLASGRTVLYGNVTFSILVLSTKKPYSNFLKKVFVFEKIGFKVKVSKTLKIFSDRHINTCQSLFWKSLVPFLRRTHALSVGFEIKLPRI